MNKNYTTKKPDIIFPEQSSLVIKEILEKYNLAEIQKQEIDKISSLENEKEIFESFENLPGTKISQIVKDYGEQKISLNEIPDLIEKNLNISKQEAEEMTKYLNENLLILIEGLDNNKSYTEKLAEEIFSETESDPLPKTEESIDKEGEEKEKIEQFENNPIEEDDSSFLNEEMMKIREKYRKKPIIEEIVKEKKEPKKEIKKDRPRKSSKGDSYRESIE